MLRRRTEIIRHYLQQKRWDLAIAVYGETHLAGHLFWHLCDPEHPEYREEYPDKLGNLILKCLQLCDRALGEFLELAPEATFLLLSNTGMGPNYSGRHLVGPLLGRLGYSKDVDESRKGITSLLKPAGDVYAVERIEKLIGARGIERIRSLFPEKLWDQATRKFLNRGNSWADSVAFDIPGDNTGTIRINLKGREPQGKVAREDYEKVCQELTDALLSLTLPESGQAAVKEVVRVHQKYPGKNNADLPDLVIKWNDENPIKGVESELAGVISRDHLPDKRTGAHRDVGFLMARGPDLPAGITLEPLFNWDVAPTVLSWLGEAVPDDFDGRPVPGLVASS